MSRLSDQEAAALPWHRVVGREGRLSVRMDATLSKAQRERLEAEGIPIDAEGFIQNADDYFHIVGERRDIRWSKT